MLQPDFPHLQLLMKSRGAAKLDGGGSQSDRVKANIASRAAHVSTIKDGLQKVSARSRAFGGAREMAQLPTITGGIPFVLQVPEGDQDILDYLWETLGIEVVAEYDTGFLIVCSDDLDLSAFTAATDGFAASTRGSGQIAKILEIQDDPLSEARLLRVLAPEVHSQWPFADRQQLLLDVSIECAVYGRPQPPRITRRTKQETRLKKETAYQADLERYRKEFDDRRIGKETEIEQLVYHYGGEILSISDDSHIVQFPDSFSVRIRMSGIGFKDLITNYPSLFEVSLPDEIREAQANNVPQVGDAPQFRLLPPAEGSATVCIIDSGMQENHRWLRAAIAKQSSRCFLPGEAGDDVADYVQGGGHGTRVAGAVLYPAGVPKNGEATSIAWLQNARALDKGNSIPQTAYPPRLLADIVAHFRSTGTRLYNHSISTGAPCRTSRMSTWATVIDLASFKDDALFIQCTGNLQPRGNNSNPGIIEHTVARRPYPAYLLEPSSRIANPAQSLQAITVGSVASDYFHESDRASIAAPHKPSSFSRSGFGLWGSIKPELVEIGGDFAADNAIPPSLTTPPAVCPELVRSSLHGGPAIARDTVGTSFAAPKVAHIAAAVAALFPNESTQLYRALIINSARWPDWAVPSIHQPGVGIVRTIGYGLPDLERATQNSSSRVTLIPKHEYKIKAGEGYIFGVPIPDTINRPGEEFDVRIDVTLAYVAEPRRTRRSRRGYLGVWLDWKSSKLGESLADFEQRALKHEDELEQIDAGNLPWMLGYRSSKNGQIDGVSRSNGTVQKDWAIVKNHELGDYFGIVVRGHKGWAAKNPEATARFSLVVSIETSKVGVMVYTDVKNAIDIEPEVEAEV